SGASSLGLLVGDVFLCQSTLELEDSRLSDRELLRRSRGEAPSCIVRQLNRPSLPRALDLLPGRLLLGIWNEDASRPEEAIEWLRGRNEGKPQDVFLEPFLASPLCRPESAQRNEVDGEVPDDGTAGDDAAVDASGRDRNVASLRDRTLWVAFRLALLLLGEDFVSGVIHRG